MRFNPKVLGGLAVIAVGVLLLAPRLLAGVLPLLAVAACPLGMGVMMWAMSRSATRSQGGTGDGDAAQTDDAEIARLQAELARLRAERAGLGDEQRSAPPVIPPGS